MEHTHTQKHTTPAPASISMRPSPGGLTNVHRELILLIATHVSVGHEEQRELVPPRRRGRSQVEAQLHRLRHKQALDGHQRVGFVLTHHQPPALLARLQWGVGVEKQLARFAA